SPDFQTPQPRSIEDSSLFETIALDSESARRVLETALQLPKGVYEDSFQRRGVFIDSCKPITKELEASNIGSSFRKLKNGELVVLTITGLPRDPSLPPAPLDGGNPVGKETFVSEGLACAIAKSLGYPSLILGEKNEALVHQITPVAGEEESQSNAGLVDLRLHQDLAPNPEMPSLSFDTFMPDWLILTGVQTGSGRTPTYVSALDDALPQVSDETKQILQQEIFITAPPYSFGEVSDPNKLPKHSVLSFRDGHYESAFDTSSNVRPRDPNDSKAAQALIELNNALSKVKREVLIEPGTSVVFNNRRIVHGRGAVIKEEADTGAKRWIQRIHIFNDKRFTEEATKRNLVIQGGGGVLRVTHMGQQHLPPEFERMLDEE
ncbi:MAG TPA: hypothetical protein VGO21_00735, partial [Candidatus Paceibacterota bacterium]|nr:hypothetical protein [Candidatus Paceibacterota bacterium]